MSFTVREIKGKQRRSFQITIGLRAGYGDGKLHGLQDAVNSIAGWMRGRMAAGLRIITGGVLVPGTLVYAWNLQKEGIKINQEDAVLLVGEINPIYCLDLSHAEAGEILLDLARHLGEELRQTRMYVTYMDEIFILEDNSQTHPTEM